MKSNQPKKLAHVTVAYRAMEDICTRMRRCTVNLDMVMPELSSRSIVDWSNLYISLPRGWSIDKAVESQSLLSPIQDDTDRSC